MSLFDVREFVDEQNYIDSEYLCEVCAELLEEYDYTGDEDYLNEAEELMYCVELLEEYDYTGDENYLNEAYDILNELTSTGNKIVWNSGADRYQAAPKNVQHYTRGDRYVDTIDPITGEKVAVKKNIRLVNLDKGDQTPTAFDLIKHNERVAKERENKAIRNSWGASDIETPEDSDWTIAINQPKKETNIPKQDEQKSQSTPKNPTPKGNSGGGGTSEKKSSPSTSTPDSQPSWLSRNKYKAGAGALVGAAAGYGIYKKRHAIKNKLSNLWNRIRGRKQY